MRKFLRAFGRWLEAVAFNSIFLWITLVLGTIVGTVSLCGYFNLPPWTLKGGLLELASAAVSYALFLVLSILFAAVSDWIGWHV